MIHLMQLHNNCQDSDHYQYHKASQVPTWLTVIFLFPPRLAVLPFQLSFTTSSWQPLPGFSVNFSPLHFCHGVSRTESHSLSSLCWASVKSKVVFVKRGAFLNNIIHLVKNFNTQPIPHHHYHKCLFKMPFPYITKQRAWKILGDSVFCFCMQLELFLCKIVPTPPTPH